MPCVYINHGGGPMPLLGSQPDLAAFLASYVSTLPAVPTSVLVVTAHWETARPAVTSGASHPLLFDYGGFPKQCYEYEYPAPGSPALASRVQELLAARGLPCDAEARRGWDHGVFVPLMLMLPEARVPVVALSVLASQDAAGQIAVGEALQPLRDEGVLIVGSGASFHNFKYFFAEGATRRQGEAHSAAFDSWLRETVAAPGANETRRERLANWACAPSARESHPPGAAEHLMPLFAVFGAGGAGPAGRSIGDKLVEVGIGGRIAVSQFEFA